jgi:hypothetical protein
MHPLDLRMAGILVSTLKARPDAAASSSLHTWMVPGLMVRRGGMDQCVKQPCAGTARRGGYAAHDGVNLGGARRAQARCGMRTEMPQVRGGAR